LGVVFFFFQAEDGIRDWSVTGVQTCALPICQLLLMSPVLLLKAVTPVASSARSAALRPQRGSSTTRAWFTVSLIVEERTSTCDEIGRASCRERGERSVVGGS